MVPSAFSKWPIVEGDLARALGDLTDDRCSFTQLLDLSENGIGECRSNGEDESDAHVENPVHLVVFDGAVMLEELEDWRHLPAAGIHMGIHIIREHPGQVSWQASARDVGHGRDDFLDPVMAQYVDDGRTVDAGGFKQDFTEASRIMTVEGLVVPMQIKRGVIDDATNQ